MNDWEEIDLSDFAVSPKSDPTALFRTLPGRDFFFFYGFSHWVADDGVLSRQHSSRSGDLHKIPKNFLTNI